MLRSKSSVNRVPVNSQMRQRLSWKLAPIITLALLTVPILAAYLLILLTGADLLDGLFGIYNNTPFQVMAVKISVALTLAAPVLSLGFSIYFACSRGDLPVQRRFLSLAVIVFIILSFIIYLLAW